MMTGIQSSTSVASYSAASYVAATEEEEVSTSSASEQVSTAQTSETYTPSAEAMAYMAASETATEEEAVTPESGDVEADDAVDGEEGVDGDTTTDDAVDGDTTTDSDTSVDGSGDVDADEEVEEDAEAEEEEDSELPSFNDYGSTDLSSLSGSEAKLMLMTNQMNTFSTMLNALNSDSASDRMNNLMSQSWVNDASTFSYAGRYLAKSAAGEHGVQQNNQAEADAATEAETEDEGIDYNNFSMDGHVPSDSETSE